MTTANRPRAKRSSYCTSSRGSAERRSAANGTKLIVTLGGSIKVRRRRHTSMASISPSRARALSAGASPWIPISVRRSGRPPFVAEVDAESGLEGTNGYAPDREFYQRRIQTISRSGSSASTLDVALRAVALGFKGRAGWIVTRSAGGLASLRGLV